MTTLSTVRRHHIMDMIIIQYSYINYNNYNNYTSYGVCVDDLLLPSLLFFQENKQGAGVKVYVIDS